MDPNSIQSSMAQLSTVFADAMAEFEGKLQRSKSPASDVATLASEFAVFKSFIAKSLQALQDQVFMLAGEIDRLEMRGRRKILLIHGVPEGGQEIIEEVAVRTFVDKLKVTGVSKTDISRCHRMGRLANDRPRPILCKLRDVALRDKLWTSKAALKDTGITLSEFLTKTRHDTFMEARKRFGVTKCWTRQGFVFVIGADGSRHRVSSIAELSAVPVLVPTLAPAPASTKGVAVPTKGRKAASKK